MFKINRDLKNKVFIVGIFGFALITYTSFAYFSETIKLSPEINISLGSLNTKILKGINIQGLDIDNEVIDDFTVKNTGTLEQQLSFNFQNPINIEDDGLDKLYYEIVFESSNGQTSKVYKGVMSELFQETIDIINENFETLILKEDEELNANIKITMDKSMPYKYSQKEVKFDIVVDAYQVDIKNK